MSNLRLQLLDNDISLSDTLQEIHEERIVVFKSNNSHLKNKKNISANSNTICRFYLNGTCTKNADQCRFKHDKQAYIEKQKNLQFIKELKRKRKSYELQKKLEQEQKSKKSKKNDEITTKNYIQCSLKMEKKNKKEIEALDQLIQMYLKLQKNLMNKLNNKCSSSSKRSSIVKELKIIMEKLEVNIQKKRVRKTLKKNKYLSYYTSGQLCTCKCINLSHDKQNIL